MSTIARDPGVRKTLALRVWDLLRHPTREWRVIADETAGLRSLIFRFVLPLVVIGPVCAWLGGLLFGVKMGALVFPPDPVSATVGAAVAVLLKLAGLFVVAMMIDALAPSFGGKQDRTRAVKLAAYSATPIWVAGVFALYPPLWMLGVVGLYAIYVMYAGLPVMMRTQGRRSWLYALLVGGVAMVMIMLASLIPAAITRINLVPQPGAESRWEHRKFHFPGFDDRRRIARKLAKPALEGSQTAAERASPLVSGEVLQTLLPAALSGGFTRTSVQSLQQNVGANEVARATAIYVAPKSRITLEIIDTASGVPATAVTSYSKESANGYAQLTLVDGRQTSEAYNRITHSGSYGVVVAGRFQIKADGDHIIVSDLRNAVKAVDFERLTALGKR